MAWGGCSAAVRGSAHSPVAARGASAISGPLVLVLLVLWLLSWLLAPMVTRLLALGVSRKREFLADAMSAQFTRNPLALATALEKIEHADAPTMSIKRGSAHLCIADPLGRKSSLREGKLADIFGTHPADGHPRRAAQGHGIPRKETPGLTGSGCELRATR